jgi:hypothetical protein
MSNAAALSLYNKMVAEATEENVNGSGSAFRSLIAEVQGQDAYIPNGTAVFSSSADNRLGLPSNRDLAGQRFAGRIFYAEGVKQQ